MIDIGENSIRRSLLEIFDKYGYGEDGMHVIERIGSLAGSTGYNAYLIGGLVRDILIYSMKSNPDMSSGFKSADILNLDIDIVLEGNAERFAELLKTRNDMGCVADSIKIHKKFNTVSVNFLVNNKFLKIDLASARTEKYQNHGALPVVNIGKTTIAEDVLRRDFTINTLLLSLNNSMLKNTEYPSSFAGHPFLEVKDYAGGLSDLSKKKIRVLHDLSFKEDPTRIIRAVRFEKRLGFSIEKHTEGLIKKALESKAMDNVSGKRITAEFKLLLNEKSPWIYFERLDKLGILKGVCSNLRFDDYTKSTFKKIYLTGIRHLSKGKKNDNKGRLFIFYIAALLSRLSKTGFDAAVKRLALDEKIQKIIESMYIEAKNIRDIEAKNTDRLHEHDRLPKIKDSAIYLMFKNYSENGILFYLFENGIKTVRNQTFKKRVVKYIDKIRFTEPVIDGNEVKSFGVCEGPLCGAILEEIKLLKIDGRLKSKRAEVLYVKNKYILNKKMEVLKND